MLFIKLSSSYYYYSIHCLLARRNSTAFKIRRTKVLCLLFVDLLFHVLRICRSEFTKLWIGTQWNAKLLHMSLRKNISQWNEKWGVPLLSSKKVKGQIRWEWSPRSDRMRLKTSISFHPNGHLKYKTKPLPH